MTADLFGGKLPDTITVCGKSYPINTDFRVWVRFDALTEQKSFAPAALADLLGLIFHERVLPDSLEDTMGELFRFYACGEEKEKKRKNASVSQKRVVSFSHDAQFVYAAFMAQYHIDLTTARLHWWLFRALFDGLHDNQKICEVMRYRAADISKIKSKEQKAFYRNMQRLYKLPDTRSAEEIERDNTDSLAAFF